MKSPRADSPTGRPDRAQLLSKLHGFQRRTVHHVVEKLLDPKGSGRFLVADEVGLGKTLIARGVIAELIERQWDHTERINIVYVCSNSALARENLSKLHLGGRLIKGTRLTLLPRELGQFDEKLNFISLTPDTALNIDGWGRVDERVVLYTLLSREYGTPMWLKNLLKGEVEVSKWREQRLAKLPEVDERIVGRFIRHLRSRVDLAEDLAWAARTLLRHNSALSFEDRKRRYATVGRLRNALAQTCIEFLEPDLIILDEFQRFKDLLSSHEETSPEHNQLAHQLLQYRAAGQRRVPTLMLSATPYRMFTTYAESADADTRAYYQDFLKTLGFLYDDETRLDLLKGSLERYRQALILAAQGEIDGLRPARDGLERCLKQVMVRTERVSSTVDRDAMVAEPRVGVSLEMRDIRHFVALDRLASQVSSRDVVELWKSSPYLINFMSKRAYRLKADFDEQLHKQLVRTSFEQVADEFLSLEQIQRYRAIDPANGRLRALMSEVLDKDQWKMLWLAPSVPYWPLEGPWKNNATFSKKLVFSAWNVVPDAVSALVSYEAERRMVGGRVGTSYRDFYRNQKPLLRFAVRHGRAANMTTFALGFPCLTLADEISPLEIALRLRGGESLRELVRGRVSRLIDGLVAQEESALPDPRWHWAAPLLLDARRAKLRGELEEWLVELRLDKRELDDEDAGTNTNEAGRRGLLAHLEEARGVIAGELRLGPIPSNLVDTLTDLALGGPAILMARTLRSKCSSGLVRRRSAFEVARRFRKLFNEPAVVRMLRGTESKGFEDEGSYWRTTLRYAIEGNLQAVLDEEVHLLWEQEAWDDRLGEEEICTKVVDTLCSAIGTKVSRVSPELYAVGPKRIEEVKDTDEAGRPGNVALRTSFALRYGQVTGDSGATEAREDAVRSAFKSPFLPFVLVTTSIGQEGLDFHPWCHDVWHWNLPGNPVDLEQREGRVHRYKGLAVRRNVAIDGLATLRRRWRPGQDPWEILFDEAEAIHAKNQDGLVPYWVVPGPFKVRRCVPVLPLSTEHEQLHRLKRSLALYRLVFGQPRQEELLELLQQSQAKLDELEGWAISLSPDVPMGERPPMIMETPMGTTRIARPATARSAAGLRPGEQTFLPDR